MSNAACLDVWLCWDTGRAGKIHRARWRSEVKRCLGARWENARSEVSWTDNVKRILDRCRAIMSKIYKWPLFVQQLSTLPGLASMSDLYYWEEKKTCFKVEEGGDLLAAKATKADWWATEAAWKPVQASQTHCKSHRNRSGRWKLIFGCAQTFFEWKQEDESWTCDLFTCFEFQINVLCFIAIIQRNIRINLKQ